MLSNLGISGEMAAKFYKNLPDGFSHRNITEIIIGTTFPKSNYTSNFVKKPSKMEGFF